jgi:predicted ferric reductase
MTRGPHRAVRQRHFNWLAWAVAMLPLLVALPLAGRPTLHDAPALLNWLGRLAGISALSFLLVAAILSCRVPGFDRPFGGLTKLWRTHHLLGAAAFLFALLHPPLLSLAAGGTSLAAAADTLLPPAGDRGSWLGWIALLAMMGFLAPSFGFFGEPRYQRWHSLHRLAAVAVLAALVHTLLFSRTIPEPWNTGIWAVLATAAVASVAWRLVFARRAGRLRYRVERITRPANNIVELSLRPERQHLAYLPGQFVYLTPYDESLAAGVREEHPYTLSSAPAEACLRVAIKDVGDASRAIQSIRSESDVRVEGPYGDFFPRRDGGGSSELWIAGGIGIAPFLGRLRHLAGAKGALDAQLIYCVQDESRAHFADELASLVASVPGMRLTIHYFYRQGPLTRQFLQQHCPDLAERRAYVCGPEPLLWLARDHLTAAGVSRQHIITEEFSLL